MAASVTIVAYEHQMLRVGPELGLRQVHLAALARLQQRHEAAWFTPLRQGLKLGSYVGVVQVPGLTLEILPKTDDPARPGTGPGATYWQSVLLQLLRATLGMPVAVPGAAALAQARHPMLDLFVGALLTQAELLLRQGLKKHYHRTEANRRVLRGQLLFAQQLRHNLTHAEQFYTRAQTYDVAHPFNALIRQALAVASALPLPTALAARVRSLLLHWPEVSAVPVPAALPVLSPVVARYGPALELALLLLRHHSPAPQGGTTAAVALLFDMNRLFETYVAQQLRRAAVPLDCRVETQSSRPLWHDVPVRPDVVLRLPGGRTVVLDTKWKLPATHRPAAADLQQLFAYCHLWRASHGLLLYPNPTTTGRLGAMRPYAPGHSAVDVHGHVVFADILGKEGKLNKQFGTELLQALLALPA
ncbi:MAG: restriction endonuclease [Hymenobacter sp.]|nr:restriction endonuclease [Hymenobacter sp.]